MPEQFLESNNWRILPGEEVIGLNGEKIVGPKMVRVVEYPEDITVISYGDPKGGLRLEIKGDFQSSVQKTPPPKDSSPDATLK